MRSTPLADLAFLDANSINKSLRQFARAVSRALAGGFGRCAAQARPAQAPADRAVRPQAQAQGRRLPGLGHPAARPRHPGAADRRAGVEVHLLPPRPAALAAPRRRRCHRAGRRPHAGGRGHAGGRPRQGPGGREAGRARRRHLRRAGRALLEQLRQEAQQELAAGRQAGATLPAAALGQAAGRRASARRRQGRDGRIEAPVLANQVLAAACARSSPGR